MNLEIYEIYGICVNLNIANAVVIFLKCRE